MWRCFLLIAALSVSCAAQATEKSIVGDWYSEGGTGVATVYSITHYRADGTWSTDFRECFRRGTIYFAKTKDGQRDHVESGNWTTNFGLIYITVTNLAGKRATITTVLKTLSNDGHVWESQIVGGDALARFGPRSWRDVSVEPGWKNPACNPVS